MTLFSTTLSSTQCKKTYHVKVKLFPTIVPDARGLTNGKTLVI